MTPLVCTLARLKLSSKIVFSRWHWGCAAQEGSKTLDAHPGSEREGEKKQVTKMKRCMVVSNGRCHGVQGGRDSFFSRFGPLGIASGLDWEVLNGVGLDGVGGFPHFFVLLRFFLFSSLFFVFLRFILFFFAFLLFSQRTLQLMQKWLPTPSAPTPFRTS